jgi:hemerythrin-like metal-binding protein
MALIEWSEKLTLGVERMDATHQQFVEQLNALHAAPPDAFSALLDRLIEHTVEHFEQERGWMSAINFPPMHCHVHEHDGVLGIMREVRRMVGEGKVAVGKVLTKELAPWFENHAATMDATLAYFLRCIDAGIDPLQTIAAQQQALCVSGDTQASGICAHAGAPCEAQAGETTAESTATRPSV